MKTRFSKLLSILLSLCMILSMTSFMAFAEEETPTEFYVQFGANGNGLTAETPAGTLAEVVATVNTYYPDGGDVDVYIIRNANEPTDGYFNSAEDCVYPEFSGIPGHKATITYKSYDEENISSIISYNKWASSQAPGHVMLGGPSVFDGIRIIDSRTDNHTGDFYFNGHNVEFINTTLWVGRKDDNYKLTPWAAGHMHAGGIRNFATLPSTPTVVTLDKAVLESLNDFNLSGYADKSGTNAVKWKNDLTAILGDGTVKVFRIDGAAGSYAASFAGNVNIVFNGTEVKSFSNNNTPNIAGALQVIRNGGASVAAMPELTCDVYDLTSGEGVVLDITDTVGTFEVVSDGVAYTASANGYTYYYGENEIALAPGAYTVEAIESVDALIETLDAPVAPSDKQFDGWDTSVAGVITAKFAPIETEDPTTYYVKKGATGDGRTFAQPAGEIRTVIASINEDGHTTGDDVTVYVIDSGEAAKEVIDGDYVLGYSTSVNYDCPAHTATIKWTSYDENVRSIIAHCNWQSADSNGIHWSVQGPSIFENLMILDVRNSKNGGTDIYLNHYPVEFHDVIFADLEGVNQSKPGKVFYPSSTHFAMGMIRGNKTVERDSYVYIDNADIIGDYLNVMGYTDSGKAQGVDGNVTLEVAGGTIKNLRVNGSNAGATETINGNLNIVLHEGVTVNALAQTSKTIVTGAVQIVRGYGVALPSTVSAYASAEKSSDAPVYNVVAGVEGLELSLTDTVGTFAVDAEGYAYAVSADGKTVYYGEDEITVPAGEYTILVAESVDAIVDSLEDPTVTADKEFKGWDTSVAGVITAIIEDAEVERDPIYYVKNGGTGNGLSADTPIGSVNDAVVAINAAGYTAGDEVVIYIMNGDVPEGGTKAFYFYDINGNDIQGAEVGTTATVYGRFAYWKKNGGQVPEHTATIVLKPYDTEVETFLAQSDIIGLNTNYTLGGPTVFEGLTILADRQYDRELFANGKDLTITDCLFKYQSASHSNNPSKFSGIANGHERVQVGGPADNGKFAGSTIRIESPMTTNNTTYGLEITGTFSASYTGNVKVYVDHEDFAGTILWGRGAGTFNGGLSLILNNGTVTNHKVTKKVNNVQVHSDTIVNGDLQVIVNEGATMNELPDTIKADKTWVVTTEGVTLDVTDVAGTFAITSGLLYNVSDDKRTITYSDDDITLAAGTHTVKGVADLETLIASLEAPELDEDEIFLGWNTEVDGVITANIKSTTYYIQANATGTGLSADSPVATLQDAIGLINAAGFGEGDEVTVYVLNGVAPEGATREFYFYDKDGNDIYNKDLKGGKHGRVTAFAPGKDGGKMPEHTCTINVKAYDPSVTTYLAYVEYLGTNSGVVLRGDYTFENITIVATRQYDRELFLNGHSATFENCHFTYNQGGEYEGTAFCGFNIGNERVLLGANSDNMTVPGGDVVVNSIMTVQNDTRYGISLPGPKITTFANEVNVTVDHKDFVGQILWGEAAATFTNGLNVVLENGNVKNASKNNKEVVVTGGLQVLVNDGATMTAMLSNVKADNAWIVTAVGADLALTEVDGTFAVPEGKVAYATTVKYPKFAYYSVNGFLKLPAGTYTVYFADSLDDAKAAIVPFEDAANKFIGWTEDAENFMLIAQYEATGEDVVYYVQHGATGNGLTLETPGSFKTVISAINELYTADDTVIIKIVKTANEKDSYTVVSAEEAQEGDITAINQIALASIADIPAHEAMIVLTSADPEDLSWLTQVNSYSLTNSDNNGGNVELSGPTTITNIKLLDNRNNWHSDFYTDAHSLKLCSDIQWYSPKASGQTLNLKGEITQTLVHAGSRSTKTFNTSAVIEIEDGVQLGNGNGIGISGYNTSGTMTFNEDITYKIGTGTLQLIRVDNMNGGATYFKKNVNMVFNGTTVNKIQITRGESKGTTVDGAIQIISNNANIKVYEPNANLVSKTYYMTVTGAGKLDVTETAGKYTVTGGTAVATNEAGDIFTSVDGILTVPAPGNYTVIFDDYVVGENVINFYTTVEDFDLTAIDYTIAENEIFLGWVFEDGTAPDAFDNEFKAGDKLVAKFVTMNEESFYIKGAQVRTKDPAGLRYIVEFDNEFYAALTEYSAELTEAEEPHFGSFVIPENLYDTVDHAYVPAYKLYDETDEYTQYTVCLINISEYNYMRNYTVYGYVEYVTANGIPTALYTDDYSTSIYSIAKAALDAGEDHDFLKEIVDYGDSIK